LQRSTAFRIVWRVYERIVVSGKHVAISFAILKTDLLRSLALNCNSSACQYVVLAEGDFRHLRSSKAGFGVSNEARIQFAGW